MRAAALLLFTLVALDATAATVAPGPCASKFTIGTSANVVITFSETLPPASDYGTPTVSFNGDQILVERSPQIAASQGQQPVCVTDSVDLGHLREGTFILAWHDVSLGQVSIAKLAVGGRALPEYTITPWPWGAVEPPLTPSRRVTFVNSLCENVLGSYGQPAALVSGNEVTLSQTISDDPLEPVCSTFLTQIEPLASGTYHLTSNVWFTSKSQPAVLKSSTQTFIVQQPPPSAACSGAPDVNAPAVRITRNDDGSVHLHYEATRAAYQPVYDVPSVMNTENHRIQIAQPLADIDDPTRPGAPPARLTCHAEDLDIGTTAGGENVLSWDYYASLDGTPPRVLQDKDSAFIWAGGLLACSTTPAFATSPAWGGVPITLTVTRLVRQASLVGSPAVKIEGNLITVTETLWTEGAGAPPGQLVPGRCLTSTAPAGLLAPGVYTVNWQYVVFGIAGFPPQPIGTFRFTVSITPPRRRAASQ